MGIWNSVSSAFDVFRTNSKSARNGWKTASVWYGLNRISGNVSTLNLDLYRREGEEVNPVKDGTSYQLLRRRPSPIYSPGTFKQTMTWHALWYGNGRAYIHRAGNRSELIILDPMATTTGMVDGEKVHVTYIDPQGNTPSNRMQLFTAMEANPNNTVVIPDSECFHVLGFGDGISGIPLFEAARTSLESMLGADQRGLDQIARGFVAKVMLEVPAESPQFRSQADANEFLQDFIKKHGAEGLNQQVGLLRGGITANTISAMDNDTAQFLETRKYLRQDAALFFLLESMLGDNESESYNSLEHRQLSYLINCLETWLTRWEEEADYKLLTSAQFNSGDYFHKFNTAAMLRTSLNNTAEVFSKLIASRVINPNEARAKLDMNPYEGGDEFINPAISSVEETTDEAEESEIETPDDDTDQATDSANAAVKSRIVHMLGIEQKQVTKRIDRGDSFDSIEKWYGKFTHDLGDVIHDLGGNRFDAERHCIASMKYLGGRPKTFDRPAAADLLTEKILKGTRNV